MILNIIKIACCILLLTSCNGVNDGMTRKQPKIDIQDQTAVVVLGTAQDAGFPQAGCQKSCCQKVHNGQLSRELVSCIGVIDKNEGQYWIIDATPDFPRQLHILQSMYPDYDLGGILLTHAHIGHYTGLMHLGREVMGANNVKVYAMPRMKTFLLSNGPWSQLIQLKNISLVDIHAGQPIQLSQNIEMLPLQVPHRDEFSETVGYSIKGKEKKLLFIPDIDKWEKWDKDIRGQVELHDYALLDGSFFQNGEIPGRDMSQIPHPFVQESLAYFASLSLQERAKIGFIHFNHTNPILDPKSEATQEVIKAGMWVARSNDAFGLD